ncbi:MAG TPA: GNAT family N-acetyltransferase [Candidatus Eisenbacteria bacterium]
MHSEWRRDGYVVSTDPARLDLAVIHGYLTRSYWAHGIPLETVRRSIEHSIPFGLYHGASQVGFARWVTDRATFAYLGDVFVLEEHRGRGLGTWLTEIAASHPDVQGQRRWVLLTRDAHALYRRVGYEPLAKPERYMERRWPDVYGVVPEEPAPR